MLCLDTGMWWGISSFKKMIGRGAYFSSSWFHKTIHTRYWCEWQGYWCGTFPDCWWQEHVVAYTSRGFSKSERRHCLTRKDLLDRIHFVKYFRHYLYVKQFVIRTDHSSLWWLTKLKNLEGQVTRWLEALASYDMNIEHRSGKAHQNADGLSRILYTCI